MPKLDKVSFQEFVNIVQEMKPTIGFFGGRYFKVGMKSYTANQIAKRFSSEFGDQRDEIGRIIFEKNQEGNALLKKASCFKKWATKLKQKCGNQAFKKQNPEFIGKEAVLRALEPVSTPVSSQVSSQPSTQIRQPERVVPERVIEGLALVEEDDAETFAKKISDLVRQSQLNVVRVKIRLFPEEERKELVRITAEALRKEGVFVTNFGFGFNFLLGLMFTEEEAEKTLKNLAYNCIKDGDYHLANRFITEAELDHDEIYLDAIESFLAEENYLECHGLFIEVNNKYSHRADEIAMVLSKH